MLCSRAGVLLSCWQRNCRQVTSSDRASRAMMASLMDTLCCLTHIPACKAVGVVSPSLLELQLLPADNRRHLCSKPAASAWKLRLSFLRDRPIRSERPVLLTCTADSGADALWQEGAVGLFDGLRAPNQIQPPCGRSPGEAHEAGHRRREVSHFHGLGKRRGTFHTGLASCELSIKGECVC